MALTTPRAPVVLLTFRGSAHAGAGGHIQLSTGAGSSGPGGGIVMTVGSGNSGDGGKSK